MNNIHNPNEPPDFSLVLGGPLYQFLVRSRLATPALDLAHRRIIFISMFAWLPLLYDIEMHARFLVALPLLIADMPEVKRLLHQPLESLALELIKLSC
jgi:hypothetical protein